MTPILPLLMPNVSQLGANLLTCNCSAGLASLPYSGSVGGSGGTSVRQLSDSACVPAVCRLLGDVSDGTRPLSDGESRTGKHSSDGVALGAEGLHCRETSSRWMLVGQLSDKCNVPLSGASFGRHSSNVDTGGAPRRGGRAGGVPGPSSASLLPPTLPFVMPRGSCWSD